MPREAPPKGEIPESGGDVRFAVLVTEHRSHDAVLRGIRTRSGGFALPVDYVVVSSLTVAVVLLGEPVGALEATAAPETSPDDYPCRCFVPELAQSDGLHVPGRQFEVWCMVAHQWWEVRSAGLRRTSREPVEPLGVRPFGEAVNFRSHAGSFL